MYLIGQGNDTHELTEMKNSVIVLGGHKIKNNWRIISHSDGDIVLHAVANAILGALQLGDIGQYFKDTESKNKNLNSIKIIQFALKHLLQKKYELVNIDLTITCENIFFGNLKSLIRKSMIKILKTSSINIKATRFEYPSRLIKCDAIVLIKKK